MLCTHGAVIRFKWKQYNRFHRRKWFSCYNRYCMSATSSLLRISYHQYCFVTRICTRYKMHIVLILHNHISYGLWWLLSLNSEWVTALNSFHIWDGKQRAMCQKFLNCLMYRTYLYCTKLYEYEQAQLIVFEMFNRCRNYMLIFNCLERISKVRKWLSQSYFIWML